ncbi:MAG TPA: DUF192 domain-containing protein [Acidimicrobiales bacterium]|nr:DUF192 domain-containing protein [Acidimicrobiales bacterium]
MTSSPVELPESLPPGLRRTLAWFSTETGRRALWWIIGVLLALTFLGFLAVGANGPADPTFAGEESVALRVTAADGREQVHCVLVADDAEERARGLMERTDLGPYAGMAFVYQSDVDHGFHMKNTPLPLTVAWYRADGSFVSSADMDPCPQAVVSCPPYKPAGAYRIAVEVPKGRAGALGIGPGSKAAVASACA